MHDMARRRSGAVGLLLAACAPVPTGSWAAWAVPPGARRGHASASAALLLLQASRAPPARAMFSGIVEEMGTVRRLEKVDRMEMWDGSVGEGWELEVNAEEAVRGATLGCSIAVNGVCLTATEFDESKATFGLAPETLRRSNLASLKAGDPVNLERALPADGRNSGHFVQGHVRALRPREGGHARVGGVGKTGTRARRRRLPS